MSTEVKRYEAVHIRYEDGNIRYGEGCEVEVVTAADYDALLAERDALKGQVETLIGGYANSLDVVNEVTAILPGAHYMDPPDGGDVSIPEQVRRMAKDAERYRWLRMADWWDSPLCAVRNPAKQVKPGSDCPSRYRLDDAIDAALQGEQP